MVPTIRDVARRARVSISTVSRVLNNSAAVDEEKRKRVVAAARDLDYVPNPAARSLLGQSTGGIGVLLPYIAGEFFSDFLHGIDRYTSENGYYLIVSSSHRSLTEFRAVISGLNRRVDGLIVMSTEIPARTVRGWLPAGMPIQFVNTEVDQDETESFNFDNRDGAVQMTEHLIAQGHRRIAFLSGPPSSYDALRRLDGYRSTLQAHGIAFDPALVLPGDFTLDSGVQAVPALLALDPRPTALFAANDLSAYGVQSALRDAGLSVPEDIALAGFDDSLLARMSSPTLTTVHVPVREIGLAAIERLVARIGGDEQPLSPVQLPTEIVVRDSTPPLPAPTPDPTSRL